MFFGFVMKKGKTMGWFYKFAFFAIQHSGLGII
jgi:hypothetical protein